tara:strand:- start:1880 stop:2602 length:723 start_codon:yes stop_codon:yes gene_type:complete
MIQLDQVSKIYGVQHAVDALSFQVGKGEIVGFLGPNGAGKSTTMRMIMGFIRPSKGSIKVNGLEVQSNRQAIRQQIGYLPEGNPLYYDLYVREFLRFAASITDVPNARQRIEETIHLVGLQREARKKIGQLSKGYKQRVGLAHALIHDPDLLILDEPHSGLDPNQLVEIRSRLREIAEHKAIILSTHLMQEVEALCDRVIIINQGKLVADKKLSELQERHGPNLEEAFAHYTSLNGNTSE